MPTNKDSNDTAGRSQKTFAEHFVRISTSAKLSTALSIWLNLLIVVVFTGFSLPWAFFWIGLAVVTFGLLRTYSDELLGSNPRGKDVENLYSEECMSAEQLAFETLSNWKEGVA